MTFHTDIPLHYRDQVVSGNSIRALLMLPDDCVDAVITDPPYSSGGQFRGDRMGETSDKYQTSGTEKKYAEFSGDTRDQRAYHYWSTLWLSECWRVAKPGAIICVFSDWRQLPTTTDMIQSGGWVWRGVAVWDKTEAARPQKGRFRNQCEYIIWGSKGQLWSDGEGACLPGVFRLPVNSRDKLHMTAKPMPIMRSVLQICPPGGIVLDPFFGSGSTGKAALEVGMHFIGMELVPEYFGIGSNATSTYQNSMELEAA